MGFRPCFLANRQRAYFQILIDKKNTHIMVDLNMETTTFRELLFFNLR